MSFLYSTYIKYELSIHMCMHTFIYMKSSKCSMVCNCSDRRSLDRRRLESAHLRFAILTIQESFPDIFSHKIITPDIQTILAEINYKFYLAFRQRYAGVFCLFRYNIKLPHLMYVCVSFSYTCTL